MIELQRLITKHMKGEKDDIVTTRLLVSFNEISCLIGKGCSTIEDMQRAIGTNIHLLPKDNLPPCASIEEDVIGEVF